MYARLVVSALLLLEPAARVLAQESPCPPPSTVTIPLTTVTVTADPEQSCICADGAGSGSGSQEPTGPPHAGNNSESPDKTPTPGATPSGTAGNARPDKTPTPGATRPNKSDKGEHPNKTPTPGAKPPNASDKGQRPDKTPTSGVTLTGKGPKNTSNGDDQDGPHVSTTWKPQGSSATSKGGDASSATSAPVHGGSDDADDDDSPVPPIIPVPDGDRPGPGPGPGPGRGPKPPAPGGGPKPPGPGSGPSPTPENGKPKETPTTTKLSTKPTGSASQKSHTPSPTDPKESDKPEESDQPCRPEKQLPGTQSKARREDAPDAPSCPPGEEHIIYPKIGAGDVETKAAYAHIRTLITASDIFTEKLRGKKVLFWRAVLTPEQAKELQGDKNISVVSKACQDQCYSPFNLINRQTDADDALVLFGQDPKKDLAWYKNSYVFDAKAGQGIKHFIIDSGADLSHNDFKNIRDKVEWIHSNPELGHQPQDDHLPRQHGTCMLARSAGHKFGVAKKVTPVVVRMPSFSPDCFISALSRVIEATDTDRNPDAPPLSVLSFSGGWPRLLPDGNLMFPNANGDDAFDAYKSMIRNLLVDVAEQGVLPVVASGNDGTDTMENLPATIDLEELLVVGSTGRGGTEISHFTNTDIDKELPHVYAEGENIKCPDTSKGPDGIRISEGTSPAAAAVGGQAAVFLSIADELASKGIDIKSPMKLRSHIIDVAHERGDNDLARVVYNGVRAVDVGDEDGPTCYLHSFDRRDEDPSFEVCNPKDAPKDGNKGGEDGDGHETNDGKTTRKPLQTTKPPSTKTSKPAPPTTTTKDGGGDEPEWECGPKVISGPDFGIGPDEPDTTEDHQCVCNRKDCEDRESNSPKCRKIMWKDKDGCDSGCNGCDPNSLEKRSPRRRSMFLFS